MDYNNNFKVLTSDSINSEDLNLELKKFSRKQKNLDDDLKEQIHIVVGNLDL